jgi:hypothetical protein
VIAEVAVDRTAGRVDARPMTALLAAVLAAVVLYCVARALVPGLRGPGHHRDLDAWHALMGAAMAAMLVAPFPRGLSLLTLAACAAGVGWAVVRVLQRVGRPAYLRLGVGSLAMAAMVLPAATASAADTTVAQHPDHHHHGSAAAANVADPSLVNDGSAVAGGLPELVVAVLLVMLGVLLLVRMLHATRRASGVPARLDACCDVAMAGAMGYMLLLMA